MKPIYNLLFALGLTVASGCEKAIDVKIPAGVYTTATVFATADAANSAMRGIYESMTTGGFSGKVNPLVGTFSSLLGLSADELIRGNYDSGQQQFLDLNLVPDNGTVGGVWSSIYNYIYQTNILLESVEKSTGLSQATRDELSAEARFIRALSYFYLTNAYNKVPLILTSDYISNAVRPVSTQEQIYAQIITDLLYAQDKMSATKYIASGTKVRANKWAAKALLARVYLYRKDWVNAEASASEVIAQTNYKLETLENVFLSTSTEAIWQLANPGTNLYTAEASSIGGSATNNSAYRLSPYLIGLFKAGDQRLTQWTRAGIGTGLNTVAPFKYKTFSNTQAGAKKEASTPIRLAEVYLIRAEARAMQPGKLADGIKDLDEVRKRAGAVSDNDVATGHDKILFKTIGFSNPGIGQQDLVAAIYDERLLELFAENGHRWFDAKRSGKTLAEFFGTRKTNVVESHAYFPIPFGEIKNNPHLEQSEGY